MPRRPLISLILTAVLALALPRVAMAQGVVSGLDMNAGAVLERSDYYTYGSRITQSSGTPSTEYPTLASNRRRFAGKEEQASLNGLPFSDFGSRQYDARTATWLTYDPLAHVTPGLSPYAYCASNPVNLVDPDGRVYVKKYNIIYKYE